MGLFREKMYSLLREGIGGRFRQVRKFRFQLHGSATTEVTRSLTLILIPTARSQSHIPTLILILSHNLSHPQSLVEMAFPLLLFLLEQRPKGQFLHEEMLRGQPPRRRKLHLGRRPKGQYLLAEKGKDRYHPEEEQRDQSRQRRRPHQQCSTEKMRDQRHHLKAWLCVTIMTGLYRQEDQLHVTERRE